MKTEAQRFSSRCRSKLIRLKLAEAGGEARGGYIFANGNEDARRYRSTFRDHSEVAGNREPACRNHARSFRIDHESRTAKHPGVRIERVKRAILTSRTKSPVSIQGFIARL